MVLKAAVLFFCMHIPIIIISLTARVLFVNVQVAHYMATCSFAHKYKLQIVLSQL